MSYRALRGAALVAPLLALAMPAEPLLAQGAPRPTAASQMTMTPPGIKALLLEDFERLRTTVLQYVDAMPDSALGFSPTPGVRTFAQQIEHIVGTNSAMAATALKGQRRPPDLGKREEYLKSKPALRAFAAASYDYTIAALREATPAQLAKSMSVFDLEAQPAFRWLQLAHEHSAWTLGQTIPYLRLRGATPPEYKMPF
jgi:hypothetical protein